jgi:Rod binding domain-containing protein
MPDLAITAAGRTDHADREQRLRQAATQFEAYFMREILARSRDAAQTGIIAESPAERQFRELLHAGLAENAAGGLGLADMIVQQTMMKR